MQFRYSDLMSSTTANKSERCFHKPITVLMSLDTLNGPHTDSEQLGGFYDAGAKHRRSAAVSGLPRSS
jgi:hypothetical protein